MARGSWTPERLSDVTTAHGVASQQRFGTSLVLQPTLPIRHGPDQHEQPKRHHLYILQTIFGTNEQAQAWLLPLASSSSIFW